ncbi:MAG: nucleotidyl transferase AbiEii/AbiGii toxin family protein [Candidatus Micrarchaeota archaeon]|nr:nucleotidyl transferase AbiEii/AbiGii toxin family protein [Candidatus Micrarchaeota archaeon]
MKEFDLEVIRRVARKQKLGLGNAEKDYVLSAALSVIAGLPLALVFKGGTCIKKAYYPEFRFSSDLDFTSNDKESIQREIKRAFENKAIHGMEFSKVKAVEREKKGNAALVLQYVSQVSESGFVDSIRTEFSAETPVLLEIRKREVLNPPEYELPETRISCMALEEILAEKIHAVYHRRKPRDLYDLAYLFDKGVQVDRELVAAKLKPLNVELEAGSFKERTRMLGERWKEDLGKLFTEVPDFEAVQAKMLKNLFQTSV